MIPDFSYPSGFYAELEQFLFTNPFSFFDEKQRPPILLQLVKQLSEEDAYNLLIVLEGTKALIEEHQLKDVSAFNKFMLQCKNERFCSPKT